MRIIVQNNYIYKILNNNFIIQDVRNVNIF